MKIRVNKILFFLCGLLFVILPGLLSAANAKLMDVRVVSSETETRVIYTLNQSTLYHLFTLDHPDRLVLDLKGARLATDIHSLRVSDQNIQSIRTGRPVPTVLRVVLDLKGKVRYTVDSNRTQIILNIKNITLPRAADSLTTRVSPSHSPHVDHAPIVKQPVAIKTTSLVSHRAEEPTKKIVQNRKKEIPRQAHVTVVVIDPGHGGKDTGAIGPDGTYEKNVVLAIAKRLAELINHQPNMHAELTRQGDYFLTLRERLNVAREKKADIFIAVHADSFFDNRSTGVSIYTLSKRGATSEAARWIASRENTSELDGVELNDQSHEVRSVLIDLAQTATIRDSLRLGTTILNSLDDITKLHYRRVEQAPFVVLKSPDIPSVLVETGFISNPKEEEKLKDPRYQQKLASALLRGVRRYIASQ